MMLYLATVAVLICQALAVPHPTTIWWNHHFDTTVPEQGTLPPTPAPQRETTFGHVDLMTLPPTPAPQRETIFGHVDLMTLPPTPAPQRETTFGHVDLMTLLPTPAPQRETTFGNVDLMTVSPTPGPVHETTPYAQPPCPVGWTEFLNQGVCVRAIYDLKLTFDEARNYCQAEGGDLVTVVKSKQDKDFVNALLSKGVFYWIGLWDPLRDRRFQFVDGVELPWGTWNAFMKGEPNNLNRKEYCVEMKNGKWFDKRCDRKRNFVCQHWLYSIST